MEIRELRYFLTVARLKNISRAAKELHISQPALSRQLLDLEEELGAKLLIRGKCSTTLTEAGRLLREQATDLVAIADKTETLFHKPQELLAGDIDIGCAETIGMKFIGRAVRDLQAECPFLRFHLMSANEQMIKDGLEKGTLDFGVLSSPANVWQYGYEKLLHRDRWGILMPSDSALAVKNVICAADL